MGEVASFLATRIAERGHAINVALVETAALLHDVDKALPPEDKRREHGHGYGGAIWAHDEGLDEIAAAIADHPVGRLMDDGAYLPWAAWATVEERVVAYADKRAHQDVVSLAERFAEWIERHGASPEMDVARERANELERQICEAAGIEPADVQRNPWVAAASA
ncbi:MAG TPA: HD domain-containing protein [Candidatus Limnocylindrales bacterium]|nr:HD domain-containing protein [Candidatus Limnocylindrales bacterium]